MTKTVAFYTLGCKVNQYESRHLEELFRSAGYMVTDPAGEALVYVVNTCTVTRLADRKSRQFMRRVKRQNPSSVLVVMGCYPQTNPEEVGQIEEADIILGNEDKGQALQRVEEYLQNMHRHTGGDALRSPAPAAHISPDQRARALLKIQDGCDRYCAYCVIPYARGAVRSRALKSIVGEAEALIASGYRELVLTGINTALYGADLGGGSGGVADVVAALDALPGDFRIRLGSLEPTVVDAAYVQKLLAFDKLCHHMHLSAQSGSDRILKAMNRRYTVAEYLKIVQVLRAADPYYGLTTDIITGFPGETEEDFQQSLELVREVGYLKVHGFPYSRRPLTPAADAGGQIPAPVKKERNRRLEAVADEVAASYLRSIEGQRLRVLPEETICGEGGLLLWKGHSDHFVTAYGECPSGNVPPNELLEVVAKKPWHDGVMTGKE